MKTNEKSNTPIEQNPIEQNQGIVDAGLVILSQYMAQFFAAESLSDKGAFLLSTEDIVQDLQAMCELDINAVAQILVNSGFHTHHDADGRHGWLLVRRPRELDPNKHKN